MTPTSLRASDRLVVGAVALLPVQIEFGGSNRFAPSDVLAILALASAAQPLVVPRRVFGRMASYVLIIWTGACIGAVYGTLENQYIGRCVGVVALLALTVGCFRATEIGLGDRLVRAYIYGAFGSVVVAAANEFLSLDRITGIPIAHSQRERFSALLIDANNAGLAIAAAVLLVAYNAGGLRVWIRVVGGMTLAIALVATASRTAIIGLGISLVLGPFLARTARAGKVKRAKVRRAFLAIPLILIVAVLLPLLSRQLDLDRRPDTIGERFGLAQSAVEIMSESPVTGGGLGAAEAAAGKLPHVTLLWIGADLGLLGLAGIWIALLGPSLRVISRLPRTWPRTGFGVSGVVLLYFTGSFAIEASFQRGWWAFLGIGLARLAAADARPAIQQAAAVVGGNHRVGTSSPEYL